MFGEVVFLCEYYYNQALERNRRFEETISILSPEDQAKERLAERRHREMLAKKTTVKTSIF